MERFLTDVKDLEIRVGSLRILRLRGGRSFVRDNLAEFRALSMEKIGKILFDFE